MRGDGAAAVGAAKRIAGLLTVGVGVSLTHVGGSLLLAVLTLHYVERPVRYAVG